MDIYKASKRLSETHTAKYKPSHGQFLLHKKFTAGKQKARKASTEFQVKNLYFCCIKCYTCIQIFLHKLHLHETPSHVFINRFKAERFSAFLTCDGILFTFLVLGL